jgi:hypothetical protein
VLDIGSSRWTALAPQLSSYLIETDNGYTLGLCSTCSLHILEIPNCELDGVDWGGACDEGD